MAPSEATHLHSSHSPDLHEQMSTWESHSEADKHGGHHRGTQHHTSADHRHKGLLPVRWVCRPSPSLEGPPQGASLSLYNEGPQGRSLTTGGPRGAARWNTGTPHLPNHTLGRFFATFHTALGLVHWGEVAIPTGSNWPTIVSKVLSLKGSF